MSQMLTIEQLSDDLQVPVKTIYGWQAKKYGPRAIRVGKYLRWRPEDIEAWKLSLLPAPNVTPIGSRKSA
ncbi:helix-turn-helix domain-containing protein [Leifsonia sp. ZF2019]|uniref:helix-turn-helix transcriptional regulator n=1 Tax=Leifsonia sp. ZF2019 TaxID=2781978 RepID=UPI001CC100EB|nr:helix-turn-helix domain-containing protein [Leifsonia sp. ZF2019]UAJ80193.1 helix-turn-helix domain-containing protein [Leifsonia sp. ZF2019]